jgi:hypothetical protein
MKSPRSLLLALSLVGLSAMGMGCRKPPPVIEAGGVRVTPSLDQGTQLAGGELAVWQGPGNMPDVGVGLRSFRFRDFVARGPFAIEVTLDDVPLRFAHENVVTIDGAASTRRAAEGLDAELVVTINPAAPAVVYRVKARGLEPQRRLVIRATLPRADTEVTLAEGAPIPPGVAIPPTSTAYGAIAGSAPLVVAASTALVVTGEGARLVAATSPIVAAGGSAEVSLSIGAAGSMIDALALGARLAKSAKRTGALVAVEVRDATSGRFVPARLLIDARPSSPPAQPLIFDPKRETDVTAPLVDITSASTLLSLPPGHYGFRATRGIGWSLAKTELLVVDGEAIRLPIELHEEIPLPEWVGCDLHVHARGSYDAKNVSYEDRVRSLVAVGVECAAATEHDHVGDHGPAARSLALDSIFRALPGVELTTGSPQFGHFNVYPWPDGAAIPVTHGITPESLFAAVHALPGSFIFQVNHPRMRTGDGIAIGYLDVASVDPITGVPKGAYSYLKDYDALEIFNGYHLHEPDKVIEIAEEWMRMLDRGDVHVATGSSDSHNLTFPWAGFPRTMVEVGPTWRQNGRPFEAIVDALKKSRAVVTSGPMVHLRVGTARIGGETRAAGTRAHVEVLLTSWLRSPKLRLYVGGERIYTPELHAELREGVFTADLNLSAVTRRRPLVALVEADMVDDAKGITGMKRALAITNPVWLTP